VKYGKTFIKLLEIFECKFLLVKLENFFKEIS